MLQADQWPYTPDRLSAIMDSDTLAVIEAGCCERLGLPMTIIDYVANSGALDRIDPINHDLNFSLFCQLLRDERHVKGGNAACEQCDVEHARRFLTQPDAQYHAYRCHIGLFDAMHVVRVQGQAVAVLFAGQCRPVEGVDQIQRNIQKLGRERQAIQLLDENVRSQLMEYAEKLQAPPPDFQQKLAREAEHLQRLAEAEYSRIKHNWEHAFLDHLRSHEAPDEAHDLAQIRQLTEQLLCQIQQFCRTAFAIFFANVREGDTVLIPIAAVGITAEMQPKLPHFNWKKANLPSEKAGLKQWDLVAMHSNMLKGIRGENSTLLENASCLAPVTMGSIYRGVLLLGPFAEPVDLTRENDFLLDLGRVLGSFVLTELQILDLEQKQRKWESTARLLTHQVRTALTPITTQIGAAKLLLQKPQTDSVAKLVANSLKGAHELCLRLGKTVSDTVKSHVLLVEREDLKFEPYPLSVLVSNCAEGFALDAASRQRQVIIEESVEALPQAEIDIARLTIALSNLIENAVKYSFPNTKIYLRGASTVTSRRDQENAIIEIQDDGDEITEEYSQRIFERGERGVTGAKLRRIPGAGLGLWEARAVIEAHGGKISVASTPTGAYFRQGRAHRVIFTVKLPLHQEK